MAVRIRKSHQDDVRAKIQASQLINRLQNNAFGKLKPELSQGQIQSARILLDKSISNAPTEVTGANGQPIQVTEVPWLRARSL